MALALCAGAARSADKVTVGPVPDWVKPSAAPLTLPSSDSEKTAVRVVRSEQQLRFGSDGASVYLERAAQAKTPLGLMSLGTFTVSWDPAHDDLVVHRIAIIRGAQTIDVLARQSFTVIRREENLAELVDGRLTASIQPEDLRPDDILDVAYTLTHHEPLLAGRADMAFSVAGASKVEQLNLRAIWPQGGSVTWKLGDDLPQPVVRTRAGVTELTLDLKDLPEARMPNGAPRRYRPSREIEFSGFRDWADVAAAVAPLFEKAATLAPDSPLRAEVEKIRAATPDPKTRAGLALKLVQGQVRYLGLLLTDGGYTPVDADKTWARRFGECKAKAVLLTALLRALDIQAEPALVDAYGDETLDRRLPRMSAFNHVIVRAEIEGKVYWLDATRLRDVSLDAVETPDFGWALPLRAQGAQLVRLVRMARDRPDNETILSVDASQGLQGDAPVKADMVLRGEAAQLPALATENLPAKVRDDMLKTLWWRFGWVEVKTVSATQDPVTGEAHIHMEGVGKLRWFGAGPGGVLFLNEGSVGAPSNFKRDPPGPHDDAPYAVPFPAFTSLRLSLKLPMNGAGFKLDAPDVDRTVAGRAFFRRTRLEGDTLVLETRVRSLQPEFPASEAKAASEALSEIGRGRVRLTAPVTYRPTALDIAAWEAEEPKTAVDHLIRASKFVVAKRTAQALADFDQAISLDPKLSGAYSGRGGLELSKGDLSDAKADFQKAVELDPLNPGAQFGLGGVAAQEGRLSDAVEAYTHAAYLSSGNVAALGARSETYLHLRDFPHALADSDEILRLEPQNPAVRNLRLRIYSAMGDYPHALSEADAWVSAAPADESDPMVWRGSILVRMGRRAEAEQAFADAIARKPTAMAYLTRAANRAKTDTAARLADVAAAEKLEPSMLDVVSTRSQVLFDAGRYREAVAGLEKALKAHPDNPALLGLRTEAFVKLGESDLALKDLATMRKQAAGHPEGLNNLCWRAATLGFALEMALEDCNAALKLAPQSTHILDSKAFVLLRLGRLKESVETYDQVLKAEPRLPASLYGRGLAKLAMGTRSDGEADLAAARAVSAGVAEDFSRWGFSAPVAAPSAAQPT